MKSDDSGSSLVAGLRAHVLTDFERAAERFRRIHLITEQVHATEAWQLGRPALVCATRSGVVTEHDLDVLAGQVVAASTGLAQWHAEREVVLSRVLVTVLGRTLHALEAGRLDPVRARVLAEETTGLPVVQAQAVEAEVLGRLPLTPIEGTGRVGPWDGAAPRTFTTWVRKAVAAVRDETADRVRADLEARTGTWVQVHADNPAVATLTVTGPVAQVVAIEETLDAGARAMDRDERAGRTLGRAKVDLLAGAVTCGAAPHHTRGGVVRELGVVLHVDTLVGDGASVEATGELRGAALGEPVPLPAATARVLAEQLTDDGAGTCVLLADRLGHLVRMLRVGSAPVGGWTRAALVEAACAALGRRPSARHRTDSYRPTVEIDETVRARDPVCTFPGCGVAAARCDLDHSVPHPRGPTDVLNLGPRSRRCHRYKTAGIWRCRTLTRSTPHGTVVTGREWTGPLGVRQVVAVESLPGC